MPPFAFTLALAAAVLHAFWNLILARANDTRHGVAARTHLRVGLEGQEGIRAFLEKRRASWATEPEG